MGHESSIKPQPLLRAPNRTLPQVEPLAMLAAAVALAIILRFIGLGSRPLWLDEAYSAWSSGLSWWQLWSEVPSFETHPPFYYSLLKLWTQLLGDEPGALRSLSAVASVLTVPVGALAAREIGSQTGATRPMVLFTAACAFLALSPRLIVISQDARPYALLMLAYGAALLFWLRLCGDFRGSSRDGRLINWIGIGTATTLVLWLHALGIFFAAALFGALLLSAAPGATRKRWRLFLATVLLAGVAYLPCLLMMLSRTGDWSNGWLSWVPSEFPAAALDLYGLQFLEEALTPVLARLAMAMLLVGGIGSISRLGERGLAAGLTILLLFPLLSAALVSHFWLPVFLPRTLVALLFPAYLIAAFAIAQLPKRHLVPAATALVLLFGANLAQTLTRPPFERWDQIAATLKREMRPGDVIWAYPNDVKLPLERALGGGSLTIAPIPAQYPALEAPGYRGLGSPAVVVLDGALASEWVKQNPPPRGATAWLIWRGALLSAPHTDVLDSLSQGRRRGQLRRWDSLHLQPLYATPN
jgi:hypothetical protein